MKFFTLIDGKTLHIEAGKKIIPAADFSQALSAIEMQEIVQKQSEQYRQNVEKECELLKKEAEKKGFDEGLSQWNTKIAALEQEIASVRQDMENALVPLALAAIKKIIGRELELDRKTFIDIIATALKVVSHHRKITIFVNKNDLELLEKHRHDLKALFDNLQSLNITSRDDIPLQGCVIETESGIANISLDNQLEALERAFHSFLKNQREET